jgi:hypothetical protein
VSTGYGLDTWCLDTLQPGRYARGPTLVAQALYRRLITPRGTLRGGDEESAYGFDVSAYCGSVGYDTALAALPGLVRGELLKDDRVSEVTVTATMSESGTGELAIELSIDVVLADESQDFTLTLGVSSAAVAILGGLP